MVEIDEVAESLKLAGWRGSFGEGRRALARSTVAGDLHRLRRGVYTATSQTDHPSLSLARRAAAQRVRYLESSVAVVKTRRREVVLSHFAAAAAWDLPIARIWPSVVDILIEPCSHIQSENGVRAHRDFFDPSDVRLVGGVWVTSVGRTIFDLARCGWVDDAVVALDFALSNRASVEQRTRKDDLRVLIDNASSSRGLAVANAVVEFGDELSGSPGESRSRLGMYRGGFARPELQCRHISLRHAYYETDFEWRRHRAIGEFDGLGKYLKENLPQGVDPGQAVFEEKLREDDLRQEGNELARWGTYEVNHPALLYAALTKAGVPIVRRPTRGLGAW